jgi:hypothetical protein
MIKYILLKFNENDERERSRFATISGGIYYKDEIGRPSRLSIN